MPTENRSSNTEMVSVPRDEVERLVKLLAFQAHPYPSTHAEYWQSLLDQQAEQHQCQPVAEIDLTPKRLVHAENVITQLNSEVEQLREHVSAYKASRERLHEWIREEQLKNITLRAQLDEALRVVSQAHMALLGYLPGHRNDVTTAAIEACAALSASTVPSAPVECAICRDLGDQCLECEEAEFVGWADKHFASADYRKTAAGVYVQDWMRHAFAAWQARAALDHNP